MASSFFEVREILRTLLVVNERDEVRGEVDNLLEVLWGHVEEVSEAARHTLEEPDVGHGSSELDVAHPLAADLGTRHFNAAPLADNSAETHSLVLPAVALPVSRWTEDALVEEAILFRLERSIVDCFWLFYLAKRPGPNLVGRR